jgi:hypothetical protein
MIGVNPQEAAMRHLIFALGFLVATAAISTPAKADGYRWCAQYSGLGGAKNCGFVTIEQCMATVSGMGGFCVPNQFYQPSAPARGRAWRSGASATRLAA